MKKFLKSVYFLVLVPILLISTQNCVPGSSGSGFETKTLVGAQFNSVGGNGAGGYDGKPYLNRSLDDNCVFEEDPAKANIKAGIDVTDDHAYLVRWNCQDLIPRKELVQNEWRYVSDDHTVIMYRGRTFVSSDAPFACSKLLAPCRSPDGSGTDALYLGKYAGSDYMITPAGCEDSATPSCKGVIDTTTKMWSQVSVKTEVMSPDGMYASWLLTTKFADTKPDAAMYCRNMNYGGFQDWYLPSLQEVIALIRPAILDKQLTGLALEYSDGSGAVYATSTESSEKNVFRWEASGGYVEGTFPKDLWWVRKYFVRCIRKAR